MAVQARLVVVWKCREMRGWNGKKRCGRCGYEWRYMVMFVGTGQDGAGLESPGEARQFESCLGIVRLGRLGKAS